jgi:Ca2+/Na+ antiporter
MTLDGFNKVLLAYYRLHQMAFMLGLAAMLVVDFFFLDGWATFWLMVAWSLLFGVHFMVFRSQAVDEEWVQERIIFEVYRPWDYGHIDEIKNNPYGLSPYRTELGRVDKDGDALKPVEGGEAPADKNEDETR